jgi:hypothetical protein
MNKREANAVCKRSAELVNEARHETRKSAKKELRVTANALHKRVKNAGYKCMCRKTVTKGLLCSASSHVSKRGGVSGVKRRKPKKRALAGCGCAR